MYLGKSSMLDPLHHRAKSLHDFAFRVASALGWRGSSMLDWSYSRTSL